MSDLRYDPVFCQWCVIAESRQSRPFEFQEIVQRRAGIDCPFCAGNESVTPPPIAVSPDSASGDPANPSWLVRVVPNKYPALDSTLAIIDQQDPQRSTPGAGHQEVIVLSPRHVVSLSGLSDDELFTSFRVFQERLRVHNQSPAIRHVCIFMNCRPPAGASIEHAHVQLISSPVCTDQVRQRVQRMTTPTDSGDTLWQELLTLEMAETTRMIQCSGGYLVYCPFASRYSNQIRIAPRTTHSFADLPPDSRDELALLCRKWIDGIERCLDDIAWNLIFQLPPTDVPDAPWFVDLVPRYPQSAGFELATDCWVNPVSPETAADQFRKFEQGQSVS